MRSRATSRSCCVSDRDDKKGETSSRKLVSPFIFSGTLAAGAFRSLATKFKIQFADATGEFRLSTVTAYQTRNRPRNGPLSFHNRQIHSVGIASWSEFTGNVSEVAAYQDRDAHQGEASSRKLVSPFAFLQRSTAEIAYKWAMTHAPERPAHNTVQRPVVLLTGFGPFPGVSENVTGRLVTELRSAAEPEFPDYEFCSAVLPVEWQPVPGHVRRLYHTHEPALALHFGVASEAMGFRLERFAHNACHGSADAAGVCPGAATLIAGAAGSYATHVPSAVIAARLEASGLPVSISDDAGGYLCNAVLFHALHAADQGLHTSHVGFIHIPTGLSGPPLTFEDALRGGIEIIRVSLDHLSR